MVVVQEQTAYQETDCKHFWVIESPSGPTSDGVCKNCGEAREFRNSLPMTRWEGEADKAKNRASAEATASTTNSTSTEATASTTNSTSTEATASTTNSTSTEATASTTK
jgi:hypothetical protein